MNQENPHQSATSTPAIHVLIAAAGTGTRFADVRNDKNDPPKQYKPILKENSLRICLRTFLSINEITSIHVLIHPDHTDWYHDTVAGLDLPPPIHGSYERNKSIYNGLKEISNLKNEDIILIHDAARPLVTPQEIRDVIIALQAHRAATLAIPIAGTLRKADQTTLGTAIDRTDLWELQTPQGFRYGDILAAHENTDPEKSYTDDTTLVSDYSIPVHIVQGRNTNFKITTKDDLTMAEQLFLSAYTDIRTGTGFDVHAFDPDTKGPIRLCGIDVPHIHKLKGHSDADVGLHAITDALLGALGQGDIGVHFPPSDPTFKNMDSAHFLEKAVQMLGAQNSVLNNIDLTLICEHPKIGPHTHAMKSRISAITGIDKARVNVKATTTEKLGFTGRGEGIAAQCSVTIRIKP